eukprot:scaffold35472_cov31-Tisochrysis_lutea.AAC.4
MKGTGAMSDRRRKEPADSRCRSPESSDSDIFMPVAGSSASQGCMGKCAMGAVRCWCTRHQASTSSGSK